MKDTKINNQVFQLKHFLKRNVLSLVLNVVTLSAFLIYSGVVFHN